MRENKDFFYLQYNELNWKNQDQTKMNSEVNDFIIDSVVLKSLKESVSLFDLGFGTGFFIKSLLEKTDSLGKQIFIEGCEPALKSYESCMERQMQRDNLVLHNKSFLDVTTQNIFDFVTAIYVIQHIVYEDLDLVIKKIHSMLNSGGKFAMVIPSEKSYKTVSEESKDLFNVVEDNNLEFNGRKYQEYLHKSYLPEIGYVYDFNRDEQLYKDIFKENGFSLDQKLEIDDGYFLHSIFVFKKL